MQVSCMQLKKKIVFYLRYDMSLKQFLSKNPELKIRDRILLLAQLLEAVTHMCNQNVAHRYNYNNTFMFQS